MECPATAGYELLRAAKPGRGKVLRRGGTAFAGVPNGQMKTALAQRYFV